VRMVGVLPSIAVVSVASLVRVLSSIYTLKTGLRKVAKAATSRASAMAQLRTYARLIRTLNLRAHLGGSSSCQGASNGEPSLGLVEFGAFGLYDLCMNFASQGCVHRSMQRPETEAPLPFPKKKPLM
jgi:hypothetical protein